jgi:ribosomal protein uS17
MEWEDVREQGGFQMGYCPRSAITDSSFFADKKCPFTGLVSIRGRILTGTVVSTKMHRTAIIRREYLHFIPKYSRYEKRHKNLAVHVSPAFRITEGDQVTVGQCRPLSKTVREDYPTDIGYTLENARQLLTSLITGPIQRSPCASPNWQGCQVFQQVLDQA